MTYGAYETLDNDNAQPISTCPNTTKPYGAEYDLKIGLLTADEVVFAGGKYDYHNTASPYYYLQKYNNYWSGTPHDFSGTMSAYSNLIVIDNYGSLIEYSSDNTNIFGVVPVINLRSDILQDGLMDGGKDNYFIVDHNSI